MSNITVIGLDKHGVYLEDIRVEVPYQVAVTLPATSISSRELAQALNQRRLFQLKGTLPSGATFRGGVAVPRGTASAPQRRDPPPDPVRDPDVQNLKAENAELQKELAAQRTLNTGLQLTLTAMSGQLTAIQGVLESLQKQGIQVASFPGFAPRQVAPLDDEEKVPMFIPSVKRDDIEDNISVISQESTTSLGGAKSALKALRQKSKKGD